MNVTRAMQAAIRRDGRSLQQLAAAADIDAGQLSRFLRDLRGLSTGTLDKLCMTLGLQVRLVRPRRAKHS